MENKEELKYHYKYPHPSVTTDCVIFGFDGTKLNVLLIERGIEPFKGRWALPGGFLRMEETGLAGAKRELMEETGFKDAYIKQFHTYTDPQRDPREVRADIAVMERPLFRPRNRNRQGKGQPVVPLRAKGQTGDGHGHQPVQGDLFPGLLLPGRKPGDIFRRDIIRNRSFKIDQAPVLCDPHRDGQDGFGDGINFMRAAGVAEGMDQAAVLIRLGAEHIPMMLPYIPDKRVKIHISSFLIRYGKSDRPGKQ